MIKKRIYPDLKTELKASAEDKLHRFVMADDMIRGGVVKATHLVRQMQANHEFAGLETLVLGQAYIAAALMCAHLKGKDRISIQVTCDGPIGGLDVESNVYGEIRGFLKNRIIRIPPGDQIHALSSLFGSGQLTVTRYLEKAARPYSGTVRLEYGTLAQDIANYYLVSEQIPTAFHLSVFFDDQDQVSGAGGIFLQALPGVPDEQVILAEQILSSIVSVGESFAMGENAEPMIEKEFQSLSPRFLSAQRIEFFCRCSREKMAGHLARLPAPDRKDLLREGPFPLEIRCHHCNSAYTFTKDEIGQLSGP